MHSVVVTTVTGATTITLASADPVIPVFRGDVYVFTPVDQAGAAMSLTSTSIAQWNCGYTSGGTVTGSSAATFKAYGSSDSNLLKANPESTSSLSLCS
tara:strand:- start:926 stop:1219 length:294 start_codon:yes stop_codon:yes gene_type:complete